MVISFCTTKVNPKVTTMTSEAVGPSDSFYSQLKKIGSLILKINVPPVFGPSYQNEWKCGYYSVITETLAYKESSIVFLTEFLNVILHLLR